MLHRLWIDRYGAAAAEYALIIAIVGLGIVGATTAFGNGMLGAIKAVTNVMDGTH